MLLFISVILGRLGRWIIIYFEIHKKYVHLKLYNDWYYVFNGFYAKESDFDIVYIDAVVDTKEGSIIYSGCLEEFICNNQTLERILVSDIQKKDFKKDKNENTILQPINTIDSATEIESNIFVIEYSKIINLNIRFIKIVEL